MSEYDNEMRNLLGSPSMDTRPDAMRMQAARERMMGCARSLGGRHSVRRKTLTVGLLLIGASAAGVAATQTGRDLVRWVFTPVKANYSFSHEGTQDPPGTHSWYASRDGEPYTEQEMADMKVQHAQIEQIQEAGGGRLVALMEGPDPFKPPSQLTTFSVEFSLPDGKIERVGQGMLLPKQQINMRADEILALRDAGAGTIISEQPGQVGLGRYTIRFTLSDGQTVDLATNYPPGTRQERENIFAETRELKKQLRFAAVRPTGSQDRGDVWDTLRYTLADGRTVGIVEQVPKEALTADGSQVAIPKTETPSANDSQAGQ